MQEKFYVTNRTGLKPAGLIDCNPNFEKQKNDIIFGGLGFFKGSPRQSDIDQWRAQGYMEILGRRRHISMYDDADIYDMFALAEKIKCPVLILHGSEGEAVTLSVSRKRAERTEYGCLITYHEKNTDTGILPPLKKQ